MGSKKENIAEKVYAIVSDAIDNAGYDIWDIDYHKEGSEMDLEIIIENKIRDNKIGLEDCEKISRLISPILDKDDPIPESYCLEISSAGIERELKKESHFEFCMGWDISVSLFMQIAGSKKAEGKLLGYNKGDITILTESGEIIIEKGKYSKVVATQE